MRWRWQRWYWRVGVSEGWGEICGRLNSCRALKGTTHQADDTEGLAGDLAAAEQRLVLLHALALLALGAQIFHVVHATHDVAGGEQEAGEHELLDRVRVRARRVEHGDAGLRHLHHGHVVGARAAASHGAARLRHLRTAGRCVSTRVSAAAAAAAAAVDSYDSRMTRCGVPHLVHRQLVRAEKDRVRSLVRVRDRVTVVRERDIAGRTGGRRRARRREGGRG